MMQSLEEEEAVGRDGEIRASGQLVGQALGDLVDGIGDVHRAITRRVDSFLPPPARPANAVHGLIADSVYAGIAGAHRVVPAIGAEVAARVASPDGVAPSQSSVGRVVLPAISGIWGDTVARRHPDLAPRMAVRSGGRDLEITPDALGEAFPRPTGRIVVFVHGLCGSESAWWRHDGSPADAPSVSYGQRLAEDGFTPVYLRYNTGLRISANGRQLADLLTDLTTTWAVPVQTVDLVGHSMGGLVSRSACYYGEQTQASWVPVIRTLITLGTPHTGAPLEKAVHLADTLLNVFPESRPFSRALRGRSLGVKDLRYGAIVEEDWDGFDPDEFMRDRCTEVPFLDHVTYCFLSASVTWDANHPAGRLIGDGMVRRPSASGEGSAARVPFALSDRRHLGGLGHMSLLNHPDVYAQLRRWLGTDEVSDKQVSDKQVSDKQ